MIARISGGSLSRNITFEKLDVSVGKARGLILKHYIKNSLGTSMGLKSSEICQLRSRELFSERRGTDCDEYFSTNRKNS